jgi:hypothetical protein
LVQVRCVEVAAVVETEIGIPGIVGKEQDDIGLCSFLSQASGD